MRSKMTEAQKTEQYGPAIDEFESESKAGKFYQVRLSPAGALTCNCRGWATHRTCWHLTAALANLAARSRKSA